MPFFRRKKSRDTKKRAGSSSSREAQTTSSGPEDETDSSETRETSPQRVGVVSGILTTSATAEGQLPISEIVDRHFGPDVEGAKSDATPIAPSDGPKAPALPPVHEHLRREHLRQERVRPEHLRPVEPLLDEKLDSPRLEIDPMAHIGHATTITGSIVALEDLEIQGTIEGSIRLANHQLTVGSDGLVKANVEAHTVLVIGRISGDVVASELVEVKAGGVIGGDVKSPRVIMHDGGVVVGGLDMSASLPSSGTSSKAKDEMPERPRLVRVELPDESSTDEGSA